MRRLFAVSFLLLATFPLVFLNPAPAYAATCSSTTVTPSTGNINSEFLMQASGCMEESDDITPPAFIVRYIAPSGFESTLNPIRQAETVGFSLQVSIGGFIETGLYQVHLVQVIQIGVEEKIVGTGSFTIEEDEEPPNNIIACGSICSADNTCSLCPEWCSAARVTRSDGATEWRCANDNRNLCGTDHVGIDSAIGCIPFDDINQTTAFFVRWALGVGGGVALFLIAVSGIKIMTVKDDPKRLQDARDTLSAAIAGIVLIILSVFLVRFISETLLNIF